jgi:hypothetical protein
MPRRELFSVLVKAMGVWEFVHGLQAAPLFLGQFLEVARWNNDSEFVAMLASSAFGVGGVRLITGAALFFAAD